MPHEANFNKQRPYDSDESRSRTVNSRGTIWLLCLMAYWALMTTGCTTVGIIRNEPLVTNVHYDSYSIRTSTSVKNTGPDDITVILCFSGGGTRAAALSYGVLDALRDIQIPTNGGVRSLIDEVDVISSVSGGSFTAAYYGLYGDQLFRDFEQLFLRKDIEKDLFRVMFRPTIWFSRKGRTEMAVRYYEELLFKGATFADLKRSTGPLIIINATDIGKGVRFSFLQEYFDLICSDISSFPIARAVTASSAVPILFNPVVLENHDGCQNEAIQYLNQVRQLSTKSSRLDQLVEGLSSYNEKQKRKYIHLVDGGLTDNLGLMPFYELVEGSGGARKLLEALGGYPTPYLLVISVDASTNPQYVFELSVKGPGLEDTVSALTDVQLHRANASTLDLLRQSLRRWAHDLSTDDTTVEPYFAVIEFGTVKDTDRLRFLNNIPTGFSLSQEEVDALIAIGRELVMTNPEIFRLLDDLGESSGINVQ